MIGAIAASAATLGSSRSATAASATPNSGVRVISGAVRDAPMRIWLTLRSSQPRTKWMIPASPKSAIASPLASPSWLRSSDTTLATSEDRGGHGELEKRRHVRVLDPADRPPVEALEEPEPYA